MTGVQTCALPICFSFDRKVRFARVVEACLSEPAMPGPGHLLLHVQERVLRARLRRRRGAEVRRSALAGAALLAACAAVLARGGAPASQWIRHGSDLPPVQDLLHSLAIGLASPVEVLLSLGGVAGVTLIVVLSGDRKSVV